MNKNERFNLYKNAMCNLGIHHFKLIEKTDDKKVSHCDWCNHAVVTEYKEYKEVE